MNDAKYFRDRLSSCQDEIEKLKECKTHGCDDCNTEYADEHCAHCPHSDMSSCEWTPKEIPDDTCPKCLWLKGFCRCEKET